MFSEKVAKRNEAKVEKEYAELRFVSGFIGAMLFLDLLALYFNKFAGIAWIVLLIISLLYFLACFAGICIASLTYAGFKKLFIK